MINIFSSKKYDFIDFQNITQPEERGVKPEDTLAFRCLYLLQIHLCGIWISGSTKSGNKQLMWFSQIPTKEILIYGQNKSLTKPRFSSFFMWSSSSKKNFDSENWIFPLSFLEVRFIYLLLTKLCDKTS